MINLGWKDLQNKNEQKKHEKETICTRNMKREQLVKAQSGNWFVNRRIPWLGFFLQPFPVCQLDLKVCQLDFNNFLQDKYYLADDFFPSNCQTKIFKSEECIKSSFIQHHFTKKKDKNPNNCWNKAGIATEFPPNAGLFMGWVASIN